MNLVEVTAAFEEAKPAVDGLITQVQPALQGAVPTIKLQLPRLAAEMIPNERASSTNYERLGDGTDVSGMEAGAATTAPSPPPRNHRSATATPSASRLGASRATRAPEPGLRYRLQSVVTSRATARLDGLAASVASQLGVQKGKVDDALGAAVATAASLVLALAAAMLSFLVLGPGPYCSSTTSYPALALALALTLTPT